MWTLITIPPPANPCWNLFFFVHYIWHHFKKKNQSFSEVFAKLKDKPNYLSWNVPCCLCCVLWAEYSKTKLPLENIAKTSWKVVHRKIRKSVLQMIVKWRYLSPNHTIHAGNKLKLLVSMIWCLYHESSLWSSLTFNDTVGACVLLPISG